MSGRRGRGDWSAWRIVLRRREIRRWVLGMKSPRFFSAGGCRCAVWGGGVGRFRVLYGVGYVSFIDNYISRNKNLLSGRTVAPVGFDLLIEAQ